MLLLLETATRTTDPQYTTTAAARALAGLSTAQTSDDAKLDALITRWSAWADTVVGYPLALAAYTETLAGYGSRHLMLARTPVVAVQGLFHGTDSGDYLQVLTTEFTLDREAGLVGRRDGWEWSVPVSGDLEQRPLPGDEFPAWRCDYVAGYTYAGLSTASPCWSTEKGTTSTERTLPADIEQAVLRKVLDDYSGVDGVAEKEVGDLRIRYSSFGSNETRDAAEETLKRYRRIL